VSIDRKPRTEQRWRDIIKDRQKSGQCHLVLSPKEWNLRRSILLLAQEIALSIRIKSKPFHNPNFCACAFTTGKKICYSLVLIKAKNR